MDFLLLVFIVLKLLGSFFVQLCGAADQDPVLSVQIYNVLPSNRDYYERLLSDMHPSPTIDSSPVTSSVSSATQEFLKTGSDRKKRTPAPLNSEASGSATERPLAEIISEKFLPFDSSAYILEPLQAVVEKDAMVDEGVQAHIFTLCPLGSKHN